VWIVQGFIYTVFSQCGFLSTAAVTDLQLHSVLYVNNYMLSLFGVNNYKLTLFRGNNYMITLL